MAVVRLDAGLPILPFSDSTMKKPRISPSEFIIRIVEALFTDKYWPVLAGPIGFILGSTLPWANQIAHLKTAFLLTAFLWSFIGLGIVSFKLLNEQYREWDADYHARSRDARYERTLAEVYDLLLDGERQYKEGAPEADWTEWDNRVLLLLEQNCGSNGRYNYESESRKMGKPVEPELAIKHLRELLPILRHCVK